MVVPLDSLHPGESAVIVDLVGGSSFRSKLYAMGLAPGVIIRVLEEYSLGPIIIEANGTRLAVGKNMAPKILVRRL